MTERRVRRTVNVAMQLAEKGLQAKADLERKGLYLAPRPRDESPELPDDPTELGDQDLMIRWRQFTAWADYCGAQLALAEIDERLSDRAQRKAEDLALLRRMPTSEALRKREDTMTRVKAEVAGDPDVLKWREKNDVDYARRKLLTGLFERYERDSAFLSRELTRRDGGGSTSRRSTRQSKFGSA